MPDTLLGLNPCLHGTYILLEKMGSTKSVKKINSILVIGANRKNKAGKGNWDIVYCNFRDI